MLVLCSNTLLYMIKETAIGYQEPFIEVTELEPSNVICESDKDGGLSDVIDEPFFGED